MSTGIRVQEVVPYSLLARGYDQVMDYVDYEAWARYVHRLIRRFRPDAQSVLELGCGTGSLALALQPMGPYRYRASDRSAAMLAVAREKAARAGSPVVFEQADFTDYRVAEPVDVALLLFDGLNYLLEPEGIRALFRCTWQALRPGGVFIFDQSTPMNSLEHEADFDDAGETDTFRYVRRSHYDPERRLHTTIFELEVDGKVYRERHLERAYTLDEIQALLQAEGFHIEAAYDNFSLRPATARSERIHWVVRRPDQAEARP
ncbi:class I SAM-dependent DNA methyltransferase [Rhodothermus marinus]|uniref:class I SAM-dependent DNA methyltransferase n=1 Tax=Rhodothermus marinus TaxID=29549 RepID=UPI0012BA3B9E|nr:class I SAM-dependent methyltransferase [Rhodothermus marinus]BBM69969.1 methyltransferase [Rhodothermus marinus]BBM72955.1 methyltransferase [Rhodothermus marinus]